MNLNSGPPAAVIFDMDGVLADTNPFHVQKWEVLLAEYGISFDRLSLPKLVLGPGNDVILRHFFGERLTAGERLRFGEELEAKFRRAFAPHAKALPGVERIIAECHEHDVLLALASAAISANVDFIVETLKLRPYFRVMVTADEVAQNKPHPEIFLKTAQKLAVSPANCVVIEDSFAGIEAAKRAGMKCVAVASTFPAPELRAYSEADLVVDNLEVLNFERLKALFVGHR